MANKYSKYQITPYVSQYVDPGSVQVATLLRDRYDKNKQKHDLISRAAANIKVGDGDQYLKTQAVDKINSDLSNVVAANSYENAGSVIDSSINDFMTNEGLQLAQESYRNRQAELAAIDKLRIQGKNVLDFNAVFDEEGNQIGTRFDSHSSFYQDEKTGEMVRNVYRAGSEVELNYASRKQQLLQSIAKSSDKFKQSDIPGLLVRWTGVGQSRANRIVEGLLDEYMQTDEGTQEFKKLTQLEGMSEEEARASIVQSMRDVAQKQVASVPTYMVDPNAEDKDSQTSGLGNGMTISGSTIKDENMDAFENLNDSLAELLKENATANGDRKKEIALEIANIRSQRQNLMNTVLSSDGQHSDANNKRIDIFKGENAKYQILEPLLMELTKGTWSIDATNSMIKAFGENGMTYNFSNVRDFYKGQEREAKAIRNMMSDVDTFNRFFNTDFTEKDVPKLQELGEKYLDFMKNQGGDDLYEYFEENVAVKTSDRIAFAPDGSGDLNKVNNIMTQLNWDNFNVMTEDGDIASADEIAAILKEAGEEGSEALKFAGITMPDVFTGTTPDVYFKYKGVSYRMIPKETGMEEIGVLQKIAESIGIGDMYSNTNQAVNAVRAGKVSLGEYQSLKLNALGLNQLKVVYPEIAKQIIADPTSVDVSKLPKEQRFYVNNIVKTAIGMENTILSGIGAMMGLSDLGTLRAISDDPTHPRYEEFNENSDRFLNQQFEFSQD